MDLTPDNKAFIDKLTYYELLERCRFAPVGDPWFQGETGEYWGKRMGELRDAAPGKAVANSKALGWGMIFIITVLSMASASWAEVFKPFSSTGTISAIDTGTVVRLGPTNLYNVKMRTVSGTLHGSISGPFALVYDANAVPIETQETLLRGTLTAGAHVLRVLASTSIGLTPVECETPDGATCFASNGKAFYAGLLLNGSWQYVVGGRGMGQLTGWVIPITDEAGHVVSIAASSLVLTGSVR